MTTRPTAVFFLCALLLLSMETRAKAGEGVVFLKGTVQGASVSAQMVSFSFSGQLSFSFFTAAQGDPSRKRIDLKFEVRELPVQIPEFGSESDCKERDYGPFCVSFENAAKYAGEVSKTGEPMNVVLFRPTLSYAINGVIEKAACTHAQIVPERFGRQLRGSLPQ
jgi:hypothetical protein